jgi:hypothetical protein
VVTGELVGVDLGDTRRERRARSVGELLAASPDATLPDAMGDRAAIEALYRHLSNEAVTLEAVLTPHAEKAAKRVAIRQAAYAISDTTEFIFPGTAERDGLGTVNGHDQGFLAHLTLSVAADGSRTPLGILAVETWTRTELKGERNSATRKRDGARESLRWARGVAAAESRVGSTASLIHVADREGDIYELLAELVAAKRRFIIRAAQDRAVEPMEPGDASRLFDLARTTPTSFTLEVPLSSRGQAKDRPPQNRKTHPARRERTAQLSFAARSVVLRRPGCSDASQPASVTVNVVHVFELGPPPGEPPVEWTLLTTESIETQEDVERVVTGYRCRWIIEEYFKAVKTGCAFESRQLESLDALEALLGYTLIVAYALLLLRSLSRGDRDEPADSLLSRSQLIVLHAKVRKLPPKPTVRQALLAIAGMGGHLKNNGAPGWQTLSKGWRKLQDLSDGYELAQARKK